jgi:hypothetical protein
MTDGLITEATIEAARKRMAGIDRVAALRVMFQHDGDLAQAVGVYATNALGDLEDLPLEAHDLAYRAVWDAVRLALECYRLAYYRLWRGTELGAILLRLDPSLAADDDDDGEPRSDSGAPVGPEAGPS